MRVMRHLSKEVETEFNYEISKVKLGSGSSGVVFLARHRVTHELAAVKRLYMRGAPECMKISQQHNSQSDNTNDAHIGGNTLAPASPTKSSSHRMQTSDKNSNPVSGNRSNGLCEEKSFSHYTSMKRERALSEDSSPPAAICPPWLPCEYASMKYLGPHPHIVRFLGNCADVNGVSYFAMELMDSDLGKELRAGNASFMEEETIRPLLYCVSSAIVHLHERGVAHRDIKPSNVLLKFVGDMCPTEEEHGMPNGGDKAFPSSDETKDVGSLRTKHVKASLGDFSTAHFASQSESVGGFCGTLYYKSPEQLLGQAKDFLACDMWALGCTMFEMITGSVAFRGSNDLQVFHQICSKLGTDFQQYPKNTHEQTMFDGISGVSTEFIDLLKGLLALDPCERLRAEEVLRHPFFRSIHQGCGTQEAAAELTFPMKIYCAVPPGVVRLARFKPIICAHTTRSGTTKVSGSTETKFGMSQSDSQASRTLHGSDVWPSLISGMPSPLQRSALQPSSDGNEGPFRRFTSTLSCGKKYSVARRLSVSSSVTMMSNGAVQKPDDFTGISDISASLAALNFSPIPSVAKCCGATSAERSFSPLGTHVSAPGSCHPAPIPLKSSHSFATKSRHPEHQHDSTFASNGYPPPRRVLFDSDTTDGNDVDESVNLMLHNSGDSPKVRKVLFE